MAVALLGAAVSMPGAALAEDGSVSVAADRTPESEASARAAKTGEQVAVNAATTESSQVFANPDGTFTQEMNAAPVRARKADGAWAPIDTGLVREADGSARTKNTTAHVVFSGGGSGSGLVTLEDGKHKLHLGWPTALPVPKLEGATATYADVLPDVDLKLTALSSGYTSVIVVKSAQAAKNPALATIRMTVAGGGLDIAPTADGGFVARDDDGSPVFESPTGQMWDSAGDAPDAAGVSAQLIRTAAAAQNGDKPETRKAAPLPAAKGEPAPSEGPGNGDAAAALPLKVTGTTLEITPDPALLHGEDTVFPLYIDPPTKGIALGDWTALASNGTKYWEFDGDKGVGRCSNYAGYLCASTPYTQRMYFEYPLSSIHGKKVLDATMEVYQLWTFSCEPHWYDLSRVDKGISSSTTWSTRPAGVDLMGDKEVAYGRGTLCSPSQPANWVRFSDNVSGGETNENLTTTLASYAASKQAEITFSLTAHDESDAGAWARFRNDAKLSVTYVSYPSTPTDAKVQDGTSGKACGTSTVPQVTGDTTPTVYGTVQSADGSQAQLRAAFEIWKADGTSRAWTANSPSSAWVADNAIRGATSSALAPQTDYRLRVKTQAYYLTDRGVTGVLDSAWSAWCYFRVDTDSPPAPVVSSSDGRYQPADTGVSADGVGVTGAFVFTPADTDPTTAGVQSDVVSYKWRLNSGPVSAPITVAKGTPGRANITPNQVGENIIQVSGFDAAGHSSVTGYYSFLVNPGAKPTGVWHLDGDGNDSTTAASSHVLSQGAGASYDGLGRAGTASLKLDGTAGYAQSSGPVVDTTKSFSVSAWVRLADLSRSQTVVSQQATALSGFALHYSTSSKRFAFSRYTSDVAAPTASRSISLAAPVAGVWTHLTGVYDAVGQTVQLYVNGRPQGAPVTFTTPWAATGPLQIGRFHNSTGYVEYCSGLIDEVHTWSRVLVDAEVVQDARLEDEDASDGDAAAPTPALVAQWNATDTLNATGTTIKDTSGFQRTLSLSGATLAQITTGADPDTGEPGTTRQTMQLNGTSAYASTAGPIVDDTGSFTATAWITLDPAKFADTTKSYAVQVFGQSGTSQSSWGVWYEQPAGKSQGQWTFGRPDKDGTGALWSKTVSDTVSAAALKGAPVMLTVVYDAQMTVDTASGPKLGSLSLYVNSARMGNEDDVSFAAPWQGTGAFEVGRAKIDGAVARYFPGTVDSVRVWSGATSTAVIADRFNTEQ
ncbi:LamG domain-containing protein [Streptomyces sp. ID05-04B]|uniref:LamG domain-containing protein n=1 Tax=Streptomyces sp. ID05-04B TaxID=3028661 RepID=UPI0029C42329|nr:LamG domain-containing protein [Streptomyces sp. ID05-04B]MDX5562730.1 LamG domain-containing protein [Streptomyces sp. ID05-04B]MDX5562779.1 LamG domain-containing protein [Streptomyces sp. ID05-04B]